jgi:hypothetical protein
MLEPVIAHCNGTDRFARIVGRGFGLLGDFGRRRLLGIVAVALLLRLLLLLFQQSAPLRFSLAPVVLAASGAASIATPVIVAAV